MFHPKSPYYKVCADVVVMNKNAIAPHKHSIPSPSTSESRANPLLISAVLYRLDRNLLTYKFLCFSNNFLTVGLITFSRRSASGFANSADVVATTAMAAVVVAASGVGRYASTQGISSSTGSSSTVLTPGIGVVGISGVFTSGLSGAGGTLGIGVGLVMTSCSGT